MIFKKLPTRKKKWLALMVLPCVAVLLLVPILLAKRSQPGAGLSAPPWLWTMASETDFGVSGPAAVMYVDRECRHCKAELDLWEAMTSEMTEVERWIVASPRSDMSSNRWVPPSLRRRTVRDADGVIADALGLNAVPVTFWLDAHDTVRFVKVGRTNRQTVAASLQSTIRWYEKE